MESKEINESESTLTQGTMSRTPFPSSRIFLLSFSFPGDCRMRFSDAPSVYTCFLFCLDFFAFHFFFAGVFGFLPYAYQFAFGNTFACALSHSDKDHEKISSLK
jgi:hypothetical protein